MYLVAYLLWNPTPFSRYFCSCSLRGWIRRDWLWTAEGKPPETGPGPVQGIELPMAEQQHPRQNSSLAKPVKKLCATLARTVMMEGNSIQNQLNVVNQKSSQPYLNKGNSRFCGKNAQAQSMLSKLCKCWHHFLKRSLHQNQNQNKIPSVHEL